MIQEKTICNISNKETITIIMISSKILTLILEEMMTLMIHFQVLDLILVLEILEGKDKKKNVIIEPNMIMAMMMTIMAKIMLKKIEININSKFYLIIER
jgi:hypothetical protein